MTDCPICYEVVNIKNNCVTTECGHLFHANCLMKHTAYNGYGCPCCRRKMADISEEDEMLSVGSENRETNDEDQYVLDGARWMFQRANNESIDDIDPYTDQFERWQIQMAQTASASEKEIEKKTNMVLDELVKINAISYEDLVKGYLFWNQEHLYANSSTYEFNNRKVTSTLTSVLEKISLNNT